MDRERWRRLQPILEELLDLPADERRRHLDRTCAGDPELRGDLEALLQADAETAGVLDEATGAFFQEALAAGDLPRHGGEEDARGSLLPGTRVANRYRIVSLLGRGGMGEVYRADDLTLGQPVALKFLPSALQRRPEYLERLLEETRLARQVSHPNVCRVYDIGEWRDRHFLTMEYIDGEDLASLITRIGYLPRDKALDVGRQLCAGLDAAHKVGILHRDLKPSNVMLDGRGRVRITDFGLAVAAASLDGREARAGTPAYMAPEQLEGRNATALSDTYALGLVLYELFTGRRAFPGGTLDELQRLREESAPTRPSTLVDGFDPVVERAILRCLEKDPALRPASARDVAALLPGGDPIAAALAAGETPSPDIIAASDPDGTLRPAVALRVFGATVAMLIALMLLVDRASVLGWIAWPRSADALEDNARGILARLAHDAEPLDREYQVFFNGSWTWYVIAEDASPTRWQALRQPGQWGMLFFYRHAPYPLVPLGRNGVVTDVDPVPRAGDAQIITDLRGRLIRMEVVPDEAAPPLESHANPDWHALFREAGLDPARFEPVAPTRNPSLTADARAAWRGVLPDLGGYPVRVEAAAYRGTPVFFELVVPWDSYWEPGAQADESTPFRRVMYGFAIIVAVTITGVLGIRNWLTGRGDREGAFRVAAAVFVLRFTVWILGGHHVPSLEGEWRLLLVALGKSLTDAAVMWAFYLALEPYGRRLHPRFLVSWTRLLRGRLRDPLVGRDLLHGVAAATVVILFWGELYVILPHAIGAPAPPPPVPHPMGPMPLLYVLESYPLRTLLGGRYVLEGVPALAVRAFGSALVWLMLFLALRVLLRRQWVTLLAMLATVTVLAWPSTLSNYNAVAMACSLAGAVAVLWVLRFGLVGVLSMFFCVHLWMDFPVTGRLNAPHFGTGLVAVLLIVALGAYGAWIASRVRRPHVTADLGGGASTSVAL